MQVSKSIIDHFEFKFGRGNNDTEMAGILATKYRMMIDDVWDLARNNQQFMRLCVKQKVSPENRNKAATLVKTMMTRLSIQDTMLELFELDFTSPDDLVTTTTATTTGTAVTNDDDGWGCLCSDVFFDCFEGTADDKQQSPHSTQTP